MAFVDLSQVDRERRQRTVGAIAEGLRSGVEQGQESARQRALKRMELDEANKKSATDNRSKMTELAIKAAEAGFELDPSIYGPGPSAPQEKITQPQIQQPSIEQQPAPAAPAEQPYNYGIRPVKGFVSKTQKYADDQVDTLRKEVNGLPATKNMELVTTSYKKILDSANKKSSAGDIGLIFNLMKVFDPGSTVREGEFATVQNSGNIPQTVTNMYNRLVTGKGRLDDTQRNEFLRVARGQAQAQQGVYQQTIKPIMETVRSRGYDPQYIIPNYDLGPEPKISTPAPTGNLTSDQAKRLEELRRKKAGG